MSTNAIVYNPFTQNFDFVGPGGGGIPIETINGDTGTATGSTINLYGNTAPASTGLTFTGTGSTLALGGVLVGANGGTGANNVTTGTGTILRSNGTAFVPTTATYPNTAGSSGNILTSNGTNWVSQAPAASSISITGDSGGALTGNSFTFTGSTTGLTFSGAVSTQTLGGILVGANGGTGANNVTTGTGKILRSNGTAFVPTTATFPDTAGSSGNVLTSNGTNWTSAAPAASSITITGDSGGGLTGNSFTFTGGTTGLTFSGATSTETLSGVLVGANGGTGANNVTTGTGKILRSNGTAFVPTTATYPNIAGTLGNVLTSDGTNWVSSAITTAFTSINVQVFTGSGTYTPTTGMLYCIVECVGGGGGGAGCTTTVSAGGGGGGGSYARSVLSAATVGVSQTVTIGTGGAGGGAASNGSNGVQTSFGALVIGLPGDGGIYAAGTTATGAFYGAGAIGGTGQVLLSGSDGGNVFIVAGGAQGGHGGASVFGGGPGNTIACGATSNDSQNGGAGKSYGDGGAGGAASGAASTAATGGAGAGGICIVTEFI